MKGKLAVTATLLMAGVLTAPAYAAQGSQLAATFNNQDIQSLFVDNQQPMHLAVLSPMEMKTTQGGGLLQNVVIANTIGGSIGGAGGGAYNYLLAHPGGDITATGLGLSAVAGGLLGAGAGAFAGLGGPGGALVGLIPGMTELGNSMVITYGIGVYGSIAASYTNAM